MSSNRVNGSKCVAAVCLVGVLAGMVFLFSASRFFSSPDDRDTEPRSPEPLDYVRARPFDAVGYVAVSESSGNAASEESLRSRALSIASFLAPEDGQVVRASAALAFARGDVRTTLDNLARLAVVSPAQRIDAFIALSNFVTHPAWQDFAADHLRAGWNDSDAFLNTLCNRQSTTQHSLAVATFFAKYRPITPDVTHCVERSAIASGQVQAAYRLRLNAAKTLPQRIGFVFNGDFETPPSGSAFDWQLEPGGEYREGFVAAIRPETGIDKVSRVLSVRFTHRPIRSPIARQVLALPPARYQMSFLSKQTVQLGANGPIWTLTCSNSGAPLINDKWAETEEKGGWKRSKVAFVVADKCPGQVLSLGPKSKLVALEGLQGTLLIDDIRADQL